MFKENETRLNEHESRYKILQNIFEDKKAEASQIISENSVLNERLTHFKEVNESLTKKS